MSRDYRICFLVLIFCFPFPLFSQNSVSEYIQKGDEFAKAFDHEKALQAYTKAHTANSANCKALWKIAEAQINLGEEADKSVQRQRYYLAERWARKAVRFCPDEANAHFFVAVASGLLALYEGGKQKIQRSVEVKAEAEKTLQLDPDHHGAYHALGRWNQELASLSWLEKTAARIIYGGVPPGASSEAAVENFKKAIAIKPDWIAHHKELGVTYMKMARWRKARKEFGKVLALPIQDHMDDVHKKEARELLERVEEKITD